MSRVTELLDDRDHVTDWYERALQMRDGPAKDRILDGYNEAAKLLEKEIEEARRAKRR